jgi:hypothetical protein
MGRARLACYLELLGALARIGRKFGVGDRAHIVAIACRGGMIAGIHQPRRH